MYLLCTLRRAQRVFTDVFSTQQAIDSFASRYEKHFDMHIAS